jgi:hypothetical protein
MTAKLLENKLKEAIEKKKVDVSSFLWKGEKTINTDGKYVQSSKRLIDMNEFDLNMCYDHCRKMLFNTDPRNPGRYLVMDLITEQRDKCGAELFLRYIQQEHSTSRYALINSINTFKKTNELVFLDVVPLLKDMFSGLPSQYEDLTLSLITEACLDQLGIFNKKHITRTFILKQGIWLTPDEAKELVSDNYTNRGDIIREHLQLKEVENLYINSKGLNYTQMRAMLNIKPNKKYTDLTTIQLDTLRNRVLFNLEATVRNHITSWEDRMKEIELVAEYNKYKL